MLYPLVWQDGNRITRSLLMVINYKYHPTSLPGGNLPYIYAPLVYAYQFAEVARRSNVEDFITRTRPPTLRLQLMTLDVHRN